MEMDTVSRRPGESEVPGRGERSPGGVAGRSRLDPGHPPPRWGEPRVAGVRPQGDAPGRVSP